MNNKKTFTTTVQAIDPNDGILKTFHGPHVFGKNLIDAKIYAISHNLEFCTIGQEVVEEIKVTQEQNKDY